MDKIYDPKKYVNSGPIQTKQFLCSSSDNFILPKTPFKELSWEEDIKSLMDMEVEEDVDDIASQCSPELLQGDECRSTANWSFQNSKFIPIEVTPEAMKFKSVQKYRKTKSDVYLIHWLKYRSERRIIKHDLPKDVPPDLIPGENLVIKIRMYHPFKHIIGERGFEPSFYHNLVVLGSQTLDVFRDKIICPTELSSCTDISNNPDAPSVNPKDLLHSGFFYIGDTFYNDLSNPKNVDYSETIIEWAKQKPEIGNLHTASMTSVTFCDLKIVLGYPNVYRHLGDCEHIFTFSDIEILQPSDPCVSLAYPMYTSYSLKKGQYCHMCGTYIAKWRVTESDRIPFDPAFFCEICFHSYNYIDGVKVGHFKAYSYLDSVNAM